MGGKTYFSGQLHHLIYKVEEVKNYLQDSEALAFLEKQEYSTSFLTRLNEIIHC